jgi:hypothetical protein
MFRFCLRFIIFSSWACFTACGLAATVRIVYLSPSDRPYRPEYEAALAQAIRDLQNWFVGELNGFAFSTPADPVAWHQLPNTSAWYQTNPPSRPPEIRFWESALGDAFDLTGGRFNDADHRWLYYIDADHLPGQLVGGTSGVALFPANDLRGLNGESLVPINPGDSSVNPGFDRWVGGLGHELGHALGLDHPPDSPGGADDQTLMYLGYLSFPNTYLRPVDKTGLLSSGFFEEFPGDFDFNGTVAGNDFLLWQRGKSPHPGSASDFVQWVSNFGAARAAPGSSTTMVPEPASWIVLLLLTLVIQRRELDAAGKQRKVNQ